jgi:hypothetical protein
VHKAQVLEGLCDLFSQAAAARPFIGVLLSQLLQELLASIVQAPGHLLLLALQATAAIEQQDVSISVVRHCDECSW